MVPIVTLREVIRTSAHRPWVPFPLCTPLANADEVSSPWLSDRPGTPPHPMPRLGQHRRTARRTCDCNHRHVAYRGCTTAWHDAGNEQLARRDEEWHVPGTRSYTRLHSAGRGWGVHRAATAPSQSRVVATQQHRRGSTLPESRNKYSPSPAPAPPC